VSYFYDNLTNAKGKLTKVTSSVSTTEYTAFDILGRVTGHKQTTDGQDYLTGYAYNLSGAMVEQVYPSGRVVRNVLDGNGDLSMVQSARCANTTGVSASCSNPHGYWNYAQNFTYNAAGAVTSMQLGNGKWESTQFNSRLQPTQIALGTVQNGHDKLRLQYGYGSTDNNGNVMSQTITVPTVGVNTGFTAVQSYQYDSLNRLNDATENVTPHGGSAVQSWRQAFTFDRYGNRNFDESLTTTLPKECNGNTEVCEAIRPIVNPSVNTANNRLNGYTFDASGNTIVDAENRIFTYDAENKQTEVRDSQNTVIGQYRYDGDGKRVKKIVPATGETTIFVYDASGKSIAEYSTTVESVENAKVAYLTNDHLGSPRINTDRDGNVIARHDYHPFGEEVNGTGGRAIGLNYDDDTVRQQFTGYERDNETGLDFAQARYFHAGFGRFSSPDDFANDSQVADPSSWNKYVYVRNNPLKYIDTSGKRATITIETDEENKTVKIKISASIAFYGEKGISMERLNEAAEKAADKIANAWAGNFKKDGMTVTVDTAISWATSESKEGAEALGYQNVIGFVDGNADSSADSRVWSGGFDVFSDVPDRGRWNINSVDTAVPQHEFGHLLGVWDQTEGNNLMNTNLLSNPSNSTRALDNDFERALGGAIDAHRNESRVRVAVGRQWDTLNSSSIYARTGKPQNHQSTRLLRAGRIFWN
jgi:RHS repeat-associated protein